MTDIEDGRLALVGQPAAGRTGEADRPSLQELLDATSLQTRARERAEATVPVDDALAPLLPDGGLLRGAVTEVGDAGLLVQLAAVPAATGAVWSAVIDIPEFGDQAARSAGVPIERLAHVENSQGLFADVVVALAPAFRLLLVRPPAGMTGKMAARLDSHLRAHGTVVLAYGGHWPGAQLRLDVTHRLWRGLGDGWGQLTERQVRVECTGRRTRGRARSAELILPDAAGRVSRPAERLFETARQARTVFAL
ncbi:hypothetical protein [Kitasatospora aburaviensis]|uniref:Uncharacterized protein n=1 Tax=Kitasatospora aburaviensis TaxID=67265 RepID=A0ABW1F4B3_9ACTN